MFTYEITEDNVVHGFEDGKLFLVQPFVPNTKKPFATREEATIWAEGKIAQLVAWAEEDALIIQQREAEAAAKEEPTP